MKKKGNKYVLDEFDILIERMGYPVDVSDDLIANVDDIMETDVDNGTDSLTDLLEDLGIETDKEDTYSLIIWNDEVNDMLHVVLALYEVCHLDNDEAMRVMLEAHKNGKAVAKRGKKEEMDSMKILLNKRNIEATVEK